MPTTACPVCGLPATVHPARYPGEARPPRPPPPDAAWQRPTGACGVITTWYEITCSRGYHRTLIPAADYLALTAESP